MDYQLFVDSVNMPCCVIAVGKRPDGSCGDISIECANSAYKEIMGPAYYDGMPYYELVPKDNKFEDFCYRAAVLGRRMHAYVETKALGSWTDQTLIPLASGRDDTGYCQFVFEFTRRAEADRMASVSFNTAGRVISACIKMMGAGDLADSLGEVLSDILEISSAEGCRVVLLDKEGRRAVNFCERTAEGAWPMRDPDNDIITYELVQSWEEMIGVSNAVIVKDESDMAALEARNPVWVSSMRSVGVYNIVLMPLRRENAILGYLYIVNFDVSREVEIKELIELLSFFLSSEIYNYLLLHKLEELSNLDALTGLSNRRAMLKRMRDISEGNCPCRFGVVNVDLNGLKAVNDSEGHEAGDRLLIHSAEMLRKVFYQDDIFRTGGDEFVVIMRDIGRNTFERKVRRLREDVRKHGSVSFAIGSFWSDGSTNVNTAFRCADEMMYADKKAFYEKNPEFRR